MSAPNQIQNTTPSTPTYDFDPQFQQAVATLLCRDPIFASQAGDLIRPDYFEDPYVAQLVSLSQDYQNNYGACPAHTAVWTQILKDAINDNRIRKDMAQEMLGAARDMLSSTLSDRQFVLDKVSTFARHQAVNAAMLTSINLMDKNDFDGIEKCMEEALNVGANSDFEVYDYFERSKQREQYRADIKSGKIQRSGVPTGLKKLDSLLYHHGWGKRELSCLMGGAKKGKSMGLGFFANRAALQGYTALYITLEVSTQIIADRADAAITGTDMNDLIDKADSVNAAITTKASSSSTGDYFLVSFPSGTLTPKGVERVLDKFRTRGVLFDMVVVDYADIMAPNVRTGDARAESRSIWVDLRGLADKHNIALLTATQTNREGFKEATAKAEHVADDFSKVREADLVISINRTEEETASGKARLYFAATRNGEGDFTINIEQDLSKMQFITRMSVT